MRLGGVELRIGVRGVNMVLAMTSEVEAEVRL
jgi:hypothetical protein